MKVLIISNKDSGLYVFRKELLEELVKTNVVYFTTPNGEFIEKIIEIGCKFIEQDLDRHSLNPLKELILYKNYKKIINKVNPDVVLTYTIKPNIYCGLICKKKKIPYMANITGLGIGIEGKRIISKFLTFLYKKALKKANKIFFQNQENLEFMREKNIISNNYILLPGSGVNLINHPYEKYPKEENIITFLIIGRIMKSKGTDEILEAARRLKLKKKKIIFKFIGEFDDKNYEVKIKKAVETGIIEYIGYVKNIHEYIKNSHATIHASHHEGMSNVLLETAATGRPIIATNISGCIETFEPNVSGISFEPKNVNSLIEAINKFLLLSHIEKVNMGLKGRKRMENYFDRNIVVDFYKQEIFKLK